MVSSKLTVKQYLEYWLNDCVIHRVRQTTYDTYEMLIRLHVIPEIGNRRIDKLQPSDFQKLYSRKLKGPRADGKEGGLSPKTVKHIHTMLHSAFQQVVDFGELPKNPVRAKPPAVSKSPPTVWTKEEIQQFLCAAKDHRLYAAFLLAITTGMRRGEILGLRRQDVDLEQGLVRIQQSLVPTSQGLRIQPPKTESSRRTVGIPQETVGALRKHIKTQAQERFIQEDEYQDHGLVFCGIDGRMLDPRSFTRTFE